MSRSCPLCDGQPLAAVRAGDIEVDSCPRCQGLWFDAGELELFPDRPSVTNFLAGARLAPGRCRRAGHRIPKGMARCSSCGADAARCPGCGAMLSMVSALTCVIDVCTSCRGVWLDNGELEQLAGVKGPPAAAPRPAAPDPGWEIPAAAPASLADPWAAPGSARAAPSSSGTARSPFVCHHCGAALTVFGAYAFDGETYCASCRPAGAVGSQDLPKDNDWRETRYGPRGRAVGLPFRGTDLIAAVIEAIGWLLR